MKEVIVLGILSICITNLSLAYYIFNKYLQNNDTCDNLFMSSLPTALSPHDPAESDQIIDQIESDWSVTQ